MFYKDEFWWCFRNSVKAKLFNANPWDCLDVGVGIDPDYAYCDFISREKPNCLLIEN